MSKQNCRWSAETKQPTVGRFVLFHFYFTMCHGLTLDTRGGDERNRFAVTAAPDDNELSSSITLML